MINTILIGAQKAGTSSLYNWIAQHPEVYAPEEMKDFHFFTIDKFYKQGLSFLTPYYNNVKGEKVIMKGAVNYIYFPIAAERLHQYNYNLKFLLILRNPYKRAISAYNYFYKLGTESLSFEDALVREATNQLNTLKEKADFAYLEHGYYYQQIMRYFEFFRADQFKILIYEELMQEKEESMRGVFSFLEVDDTFVPDFQHVNETGNVKYRKINLLFFGDSAIKRVLRPFLNNLPLSLKIRFGTWMREVNKREASESSTVSIPHPYMHAYDDDIKALSYFLRKDLTKLWKHE